MTPYEMVLPEPPQPVTLQGMQGSGPQARVIHSLKQLMEDGVLSAGSVVPSERVLSEQFNVNRGTVRRALQVLQDEGFLRTQNGRTRIVTDRRQPRGGVMQHTIAVLQPYFAESNADHHQSGRLEYIGRGTLKAIQSLSKHVISLNPERLTREEIERLAQDSPFGVIIADLKKDMPVTADLANAFRRAGVPVVVYGDAPELRDFDRVTSGHALGAYHMTKWLISQGRTRIANCWVVPTDRYWYAQRLAGYTRALEEAGLPTLPLIEIAPFPDCNGDIEIFKNGVRATAGYLVEHLLGPDSVDALMLGTDSDVFGVAAACRLCGKEPQKDVVIAGYDNYWVDEAARQFEPTIPVATVDKLNERMGVELVRLLHERVEGRLPQQPHRRVVTPEVVVVDQNTVQTPIAFPVRNS